MAKRFECPSCGAGVKPRDRNCFRCGVALDVEPMPSSPPSNSVQDLDGSGSDPSGEV